MSDRVKLAIAAAVVAVIAAWSIHGVGGASSTAAQDKLRARVLERLVAVGEDDWAEVFMDGQHVVLGGNAPDEEALAIAAGAVRSAVWGGGRSVGGVTVVTTGAVDVVPPRTTPYVWRAELDDRILRLAGSAVSQETADELERLAGALFSDHRIEDDLDVDRRAPGEGWPEAARGALVVLSRLEEGVATLSDFELSVTGEAADAAAAEAARAALSRLGNTLSATSRINVRVADPPAPPAVPVSPAPAPPAAPPLRGVPEDATGPDEVAIADDAENAATDATGEADEPPGEVAEPVDLALNEAVSDTPDASADEDDADGAEPAAEDAAAPSVAQPEDRAATALAQCQTAIDESLSSGPILFAFNRADVSPESAPVLEALAAALAGCPSVDLSIEGHTDGVGAAEANQALSERRAGAVRDRLVALGVDEARLTAAGFGESRPVAENTSVEGRRANRRIEIIVSP